MARTFRSHIAYSDMLNFLQKMTSLAAGIATYAQATQAFDTATAYRDAGEHRKAAPLLKEAAEAGYPNAMAVWGSALLMGQGVPMNGAEAILWLEKAVENGVPGSKGTLGMALAVGMNGVKQDLVRGTELLRQVVIEEPADTQSANLLGMIERDEGIFAKAAKAAKAAKRKPSR